MAAVAPTVGKFDIANEELANFNQEQAREKNLEALQRFGGVRELGAKLLVDLKKGLSHDEEVLHFHDRRAAFGTNVYPTPPAKGLLRLFFEACQDTLLIVLMICTVVSLGIGLHEDPSHGWVEGTAILIAVLAVAGVTAVNDFNKERQFRKLNAVKNDIQVKVVRAGQQTQVSTTEINVGDVVVLNTGDKIPADGVLIEGFDLECNEASLTGEAEDRKKEHEADPFLLSGCQVTAGFGTMVVIAVGTRSQWGRIKARLATPQADTPLQEKLNTIARMIGYLGSAAAMLTFTAMLILWLVPCTDACNDPEGVRCPDRQCVADTSQCVQCAGSTNGTLYQCWDLAAGSLSNAFCGASVDDCPLAPRASKQPCRPEGVGLFSYTVSSLIIAVTVVVVAIPEGLPLAVTISLSYSTKKMLRDNNLIRVLAACETMGNATNICSDKTGTLTENRMTVVQGWLAHQYFDEDRPLKRDAMHDAAVRVLAEGAAVNSTAVMSMDEHGRPVITGSKTEGALLIQLHKDLGLDYRTYREEAHVERMFVFEARRKMMSTLVRMPGGGLRLYVKGASEIVLDLCTGATQQDGSVAPMTPALAEELREYILVMARSALRTFSLAHVDLPADTAAQELQEPPETNLVLDAVVGIIDPLRPDVKEAVRVCQEAGIMVRMVTGDNIETAKAIARQCGILTPGGVAMEGPVFRHLTPKQLDAILPRLQVLARSSPDDKHTLVTRLNGKNLPATREAWEALYPGAVWETDRDVLLPGHLEEWRATREAGEVVGVTGDGTNDAPALRAADVGLSMGLSGTEVAKEASDIVIMDDRFSSIVRAVLWGRSIYDNIRKFLQFQLTVNVVAVLITFVGAVTGFEPPLNPVMMLWVNLIMDTMGALALATEEPTPNLLHRRPYKRNAPLLGRTMVRNILGQSLYQFALLMVLLYAGKDLFGLPRDGRQSCVRMQGGTCTEHDYTHFTLIFNSFVFAQVFNEFNARRLFSELNVFSGITRNYFFMSVIVITSGLQILIVQFGGDFTKTSGLSLEHWLITIGLGAISLPIGVLLRLIPVQENPNDFSGYSLNSITATSSFAATCSSPHHMEPAELNPATQVTPHSGAAAGKKMMRLDDDVSDENEKKD